jgi:hypothetical protein
VEIFHLDITRMAHVLLFLIACSWACRRTSQAALPRWPLVLNEPNGARRGEQPGTYVAVIALVYWPTCCCSSRSVQSPSAVYGSLGSPIVPMKAVAPADTRPSISLPMQPGRCGTERSPRAVWESEQAGSRCGTRGKCTPRTLCTSCTGNGGPGWRTGSRYRVRTVPR